MARRRYLPLFAVLTLALGSISLSPAEARPRAKAKANIRKTITQSAFTDTLKPGEFQLDTTLVDWQHDDPEVLIIGDSFLRAGITGSFELQLGISPYILTDVKGVGDLRIGAKKSFQFNRLGVFIQPFLTLPTGSEDVSENKATGGTTLGVTFDLSDTTQLYATPTVVLPYGLVSASFGVNQALTDTLQGSLELYGQRGADQDQTSANVALTYMVNDKWELFGGTNIGLDENAPKVELTIGFTRHF